MGWNGHRLRYYRNNIDNYNRWPKKVFKWTDSHKREGKAKRNWEIEIEEYSCLKFDMDTRIRILPCNNIQKFFLWVSLRVNNYIVEVYIIYFAMLFCFF